MRNLVLFATTFVHSFAGKVAAVRPTVLCGLIVLSLGLTGCGSKDSSGPTSAADAKSGGKKGGRSTPATPEAADEEFRVAASHKGERASAVAKMITGSRSKDKWSWERLADAYGDELDGEEMKDEFARWKSDRIAAGDRYK